LQRALDESIHRYQTTVWKSGAQPAVVLNKMDLDSGFEARRPAIDEIAKGSAFQSVQVHQVLRSSDRPLVRDQLGPAEEWNIKGAELGFYASRPRLIEFDPADLGENVDPARFHSHLECDAGRGKIGFGNILERSAESSKRVHDLRCVFWGGFDPNIEIARRSRPGMDRHGIRADDDKSHPSVDEGAQQIDKVRVQSRPRP